ncbi:hypothetical protein A4X13_0g4777 [Tilletia indica]|uniref:Uncharacterized protein n=1 Tax=Tilletia indica TaxID=43049 RepID=A0A177TRI3_9BASI|nr:hypothetical protein A4X13_0g4777 [Tilletia indica]
MVHPALAFAPTLQRALAVTQAEQKLRRAKTIRNQATSDFEDIKATSDAKDELRHIFGDLHTRVKDIEARHDALIAERISTIHAVHSHVCNSILETSMRTVKMLKCVLSEGGDKLNSTGLEVAIDNNEQIDIQTAFAKRQLVLRAVGDARSASLELRDRFNLLHAAVCAWKRREDQFTQQMTCSQNDITKLLAGIGEHLGMDPDARNSKLIGLAKAQDPPAQHSSLLKSQVDSWFRWSADEAGSNNTWRNAITISTWITSRLAQLDELTLSVKRLDEALSLRLAGSATLDEQEKAAVEECTVTASLLFSSMDELEQKFLDASAVFSKEDVARHASAVVSRNAKIDGSDRVIQIGRDALSLLHETYHNKDVVKALWESKKLFKLDDRPSDSRSQPDSGLPDPLSAPVPVPQASRTSIPDAGASTSHRSPPEHPLVVFTTNTIPHKGEPYEKRHWRFENLYLDGASHPYESYSFFKAFEMDQSAGPVLMSGLLSSTVTWVKLFRARIFSFDVSTLGFAVRDSRFQVGTCDINFASDIETVLDGERVRMSSGTPAELLSLPTLSARSPQSFLESKSPSPCFSGIDGDNDGTPLAKKTNSETKISLP